MGHIFLLLVVLLLTSTRATAAVHARASAIEVSRQWQPNGYSVSVILSNLNQLPSTEASFCGVLLYAGGELCRHQGRDRIPAAELRGEVQVLWPLRGSAGARISAAAAEEEEGGSRP